MRNRDLIPSLFVLVGLTLAATPAAAQEARWWKGNLHTHSLWSDGNDFPEQIATWYRTNDYQFLAFTEHNVLADRERWMKVDDIVRRGGRKALADYREHYGDEYVETRTGAEGKLEVRLKRLAEFRGLFEEPGSFLLIQAEEITDSFDKKPIHTNASNLDDLVKPRHGTSVRRVMDRNLEAALVQAEAGGRPVLVHLNHPNFGWGITAEDLAAVLREQFFEIYNGHPGVNHPGDAQRAGLERLWDIACTLRIDLYHAAPPFGLGTDDSHHYFVKQMSRSNLGRGWVQVRAASLEPDVLVEAMLRGDFYASSGVTLRDVRFEEGTLSIEIEPVRGERYTTAFVGTRAGFDRAAEPVRNEDGTILGATWQYSDEVGSTFATVRGRKASYRLRGDELYVRAIVTSSAVPSNPSFEAQLQQAWTQPVGWRERVLQAPVQFADVQCERTWSGPLRGLAVDPRGAIYWSFGTDLVCTDAAGKVRSTLQSQVPLADLCLHDGQLHALTDSPDDVRVRIHDAATLAFVREVTLPDKARGARGLGAEGGRFFVVADSQGVAGSVRFVTLDSKFRVQEVDELGSEHLIAPAAVCFGDQRFWIGGRDAEGGLLVTDAGFVPWALVPSSVAHGIAALPAGLFLVGESEAAAAGGFIGRAWVAEPAVAGGLQRRTD